MTTMRKKCPYLSFFWSVFSRIQTEYGETRSISPYAVQMRKNTDQNNSKQRHFSPSANYWETSCEVFNSEGISDVGFMERKKPIFVSQKFGRNVLYYSQRVYKMNLFGALHTSPCLVLKWYCQTAQNLYIFFQNFVNMF